MRKLLLKNFQSPGDVLMLTATVRDLALRYPGAYAVDVRTSCAQLWDNNPYLICHNDADKTVELIDMQYPLIHHCNQAPYHFIHGFAQYLEKRLDIEIPITRFCGDIHLSEAERAWMSQVEEMGFQGRFWIIVCGGKYDFTTKWWNPAFAQKVIEHFKSRIQFVQCGESHHWHPKLRNVIDLVGKTDLRQFVRLMYHADGVLCPVTFAMHLAAAVPTKPPRLPNRPCVVVAGGREPAQWEAYGHHQFISTNGALECCANGGCWKSRSQPLNDGDEKDTSLCVRPISISEDVAIPQCMNMITATDVIRRIEMYYEGGALHYN